MANDLPKVSLRLCSIGINRFQLVGFFRVLLGKNRFWLVWLINFFNRHQTSFEMVEKALAATAVVYAGHLKSAAGSCHVAFGPQLVNAEKSGNNYSQELPRSNQKRLERCSNAKPQPLQPKPVAVETVDTNRTRAKFKYAVTRTIYES